jgi:hypothetical protein
MLPGSDFGHEVFFAVDTPIKALTARHANLDLCHVQSAAVLGDVAKRQAVEEGVGLQQAERLDKGRRPRGSTDYPGRNADALRFGKVNADEFLHRLQEYAGVAGASFRPVTSPGQAASKCGAVTTQMVTRLATCCPSKMTRSRVQNCLVPFERSTRALIIELVALMRSGHRPSPSPAPSDVRAHARREFARLPAPLKQFGTGATIRYRSPTSWYVSLLQWITVCDCRHRCSRSRKPFVHWPAEGKMNGAEQCGVKRVAQQGGGCG